MSTMARRWSRTSRSAKADEAGAADFRSPAERMEAGRALRERVPRQSHLGWKAPPRRPDPIRLLIDSSKGRIPALLPIRYGRMLKSPFAFFRGAAAVMASDLAHTPITGMRVQACGDCHIMNFGAFATPERNLIFDINDFDETLPAPWEWDLKRLAASVELAGRSADFKSKDRERAVQAAVRSYREHMADYAEMRVLDIWYHRINFEPLVSKIPGPKYRELTSKEIDQARRNSVADHIFPTLVRRKGKSPLIKDNSPLIFHETGRQRALYRRQVEHAFRRYRESLRAQYRVLFDRFEYCDIAIKVVGVGSVGTFCAVALFMAANNDPLFLQVKEARASVLERYAGPSSFATHGERVVVGQRLMQAAGDVFLGWTVGLERHRNFYIRQLRDMKVSMAVEMMDAADLAYYAEACGWALALAHARSGDSAMIAGYLGSNDSFDDAIGRFADDYAEQTQRDHAALQKAVKVGRIQAAAV
jgi:uncharacterized protein (DUF2252 family)